MYQSENHIKLFDHYVERCYNHQAGQHPSPFYLAKPNTSEL